MTSRRFVVAAVVSLVLMLGVGGCASGGAGNVHEPLDGAAANAVREADAGRRAAQVVATPEALGSVLDDALVYVHSDGRAETKAEFMASLTTGAVDYVEIRPERSDTFLCRGFPPGPVPCVISEQTLVVAHQGRLLTLRNCATAAYRNGALVYYISRPLPGTGRCDLP